MKVWKSLILPLGSTFLGILLIFFGLQHHIILTVDGISSLLDTRALLVSQVLQESGLNFNASDQVYPPLLSPAFLTSSIQVRRARPVTILDQNQKTIAVLVSSERFPANLLLLAGTIRLFPGDLLLQNGQALDPRLPLPPVSRYTLTYIPGIRITLLEDNLQHIFYSARSTLGEALIDAGYPLSSADSLSMPLTTPLTHPLTVTLRRASPLTILVDGKSVQVQSSAETVGQALATAGLSLQNNDFSIPAEDQPIPTTRSVQVVRVNEEIVLEQKPIPFETETVSSDQVDVDQRQILQPGQPGLEVSRVRVRYENGNEVSRNTESNWTAALPVKQKVVLGTRIPIQKLDTPSGTIEYYRSITVYATSYSPCNSDADRCYNSTSNGMRVQRGVIGVTRQWYNLLAGQRVYIPGYGIAVIADIGAGVPGKKWIDLGFSDSDYESWHQNVTLYFLTPVPPNVQWNLP
jgi:resuscitation-promoting factor RpfB